MEHSANGILLVDKQEGWTSHDVVARSRRLLSTRKIGHAGTLDPMATGLLVLGVGPSTRLLTHLVGLDKRYRATIRLGFSTVTDDREGDTLEVADRVRLRALAADPTRIVAAATEFAGHIDQVPSAVSAVKVQGRRSYERVRAGENVALEPRAVRIFEFSLGTPRLAKLSESGAAEAAPVIDVEAEVHCSSGTYVRALARDLGRALGVGGHLTALRRTAIGPFRVDEAVPLPDPDAATEQLPLMAPADAAGRLFPVIELSAAETTDLMHGKQLELGSGRCEEAPIVAALAPSGRLVGLVRVRRGIARVVTNFPAPPVQEGAKR